MNLPPPKRRLAIVLSHPTQYYSPWFQWLRRHTALDFRVFYLWDFGVTQKHDPLFQTSFKWDLDLLSGYESEFVPNFAADPGTHHFNGLKNPTLAARLEAWRPDALLCFGYNWQSHITAIFWSRRKRVPALFRGDSHLLGRGPPPLPRRWLLRLLYSQFAAFLYVGISNREYFTTLGVPERKLFFAPHSVNHALFDPSRTDHASAARALRQSIGLAPHTKVILFAGKLIPDKQPQELLEAFLSLRRTDYSLIFTGEGAEKEGVHARVASVGAGSVHFLPFANQTEMPSRHLLADLFVLPSRGLYETWGLAVNEAMHMGVPALVSDVVGCQRDLVTEDETGWVFSASVPSTLRQKLAKAMNTLADPNAAQGIRERVLSRISNYSYERTAAGLMTSLASLPPRP